jgi:quercetin dioxygenase-like cupin family protein
VDRSARPAKLQHGESGAEMSDLQRQINDFLELTMRHLGAAEATAPLQAEIAQLRSVWPTASSAIGQANPTRLPACDHLGTALALARIGVTADLGSAITQLTAQLQWTYSYPADGKQDSKDLANRIAFSQIVGRKGLIANADIHVGLTLMAPHTSYPAHAHPAVEVYLVVSGSATWQAGDAAATRQAPNAIVFHPSNVPHAMTTDVEPLLAIWTWRGDLASPSVYLNPTQWDAKPASRRSANWNRVAAHLAEHGRK